MNCPSIPDGTENTAVKGITKNVLALGVVSLLTDVSSEMFYPLLPIFLTTMLGASVGFVGVVEGIAESTSSLLKLFSGWFSDRMGKRKLLVFGGYTLSSLTRPVIAVAAAGWHVLLARFVDRVGKGVRTSPRDALIADSTPKGYLGKSFGFHRAMDHTGAVIGPLLAFLILKLSVENYRLVFWLAAIPAVMSVFTLILFVSERSPRPGNVGKATLTLKPFSRTFKAFLLVVALFTLGNSSDAFLILRARSLGVPVGLIPILWVMLHVVKTASSVPGGSWSDRVGRKRVIVTGWAVYALIYLGLAIASKAIHVWILFALYGIYFGLTEGTEKALVADLVPVELRGTAYGVYHFAVGVMALPASVLMGVLWDWIGPAGAFCFGAGLALLASAAFLALVRIINH
ncbi:MFS transporter [candidate division KSB1 bacterium]|nr:MFS transporter [candidate division KSB1 bacterium]